MNTINIKMLNSFLFGQKPTSKNNFTYIKSNAVIQHQFEN